MISVEGIVEHGDARGRTLGFPTANIPFSDTRVEDGVWVAAVCIEGLEWAVAAVSIGYRETFYAQGGERLLEAHLLDFTGNLYGRKLRLYLGALLRPQLTFNDVNDLVDQMHGDVHAARCWISEHQEWVLDLGHTPQGVEV